MSFVNLKLLKTAGLVLIFVSLITVASHAAEAPVSLDGRLQNLEARLDRIEADQKETLAMLDDIIKRLDQLRIWVHRT